LKRALTILALAAFMLAAFGCASEDAQAPDGVAAPPQKPPASTGGAPLERPEK
jgi:hypothetical protein